MLRRFRNLAFVSSLTLLCGLGEAAEPHSEAARITPGKSPVANGHRAGVSPQAPLSIDHLLPHGKVTAAVLGYGLSPRTQELASRWKAAIQKNPDWFAEFAKSSKPGVQLPYDPKFGLTEPEYAEMIAGLSKIKIVSTGKSEVHFNRKPGGVVELKADGPLAGLNGVRINLLDGSLETPFGRIERSEEQSVGNESPVGAHRYFHWVLSKRDPTTEASTSLKFSLGILAGENTGLIDYRAKQFAPGQPLKRADVLVEYDLPVDK